MIFTRAAILSTLTFLVAADTISLSPADGTTLSSAKETQAVNDVEKYLSSVTTQPAYSEAYEAFTSAMPSSLLNELTADPSNFLLSVLTATAAPDWYSAVPTSAASVLSSVGQAEISIITKDVAGPAPTNVAKVAGAALAAGAAVLVAL